MLLQSASLEISFFPCRASLWTTIVVNHSVDVPFSGPKIDEGICFFEHVELERALSIADSTIL